MKNNTQTIGKIYQVSTNTDLHIEEINYVRKTDFSYWSIGYDYAQALDTKYHKSFDTKEEAMNYLKSLLDIKLSSLKYSLQLHEEKIEKFNNLYKKIIK